MDVFETGIGYNASNSWKYFNAVFLALMDM